MRCKEAQKRILFDESSEVDSHMRQCPECRRFRDEWTRIVRLVRETDVRVPRDLEEATLRRSRAILPQREATSSFRERVAQWWRSPRFAVSATILFVLSFLAFALTAFLHGQGEQVPPFTLFVLLTILIQNIMMALFIPIFFFQQGGGSFSKRNSLKSQEI